jgi:glycosyltransferase involved in cell wall biosynthesis
LSDPAAPRISVLVPVSEGARHLEEIHGEILPQLEKITSQFELLYLVGSASKSVLEQALRLHDRDPQRVRVLQFARGAEDATLLAAGFDRARGEILFTLPCDFEADTSAIEALYEAVDSGADVAFGARSGWTRGSAARLQSRMFNRLVSWLTGTRFTDIATGTRAMRREVTQEVPLYGDFHRYLPILADRLGFVVREVPVRQHPGATAPIVHAPRVYLYRSLDVLTIFFLSRFTRRPLRLFGGIGSLFGVLGAAILIVVTVQRVLGTALTNRPIFMLGTLLLGLGVQAFTIGLLGELILFFHARRTRDYRIAAVYESAEEPSPDEPPPTRSE